VDLLNDLLEHAAGLEAEPGQARVQELLPRCREHPDADFAALERAAVDQFETLFRGGEYDPADAGKLEALADITDAVRSYRVERDAENSARDQRVSALAERVRSQPADNPDAPSDSTEAQAVADPVPVTDASPEPAGDGDGENGSAAPQAAADTQTAVTVAPEPVTVTASPPARRPSTAAALQQAARPATQPTPAASAPLRRFSITASAEIPEYPYGKTLTPAELGSAAVARFMSLPVGQEAAAPIKANVARIHRQFSPEIQLTGNQGDTAILDRVADEKRLPGGSLVAAQQRALTAAASAPSVIQDVWCTPSETDFSLCPSLATTDGMLDLPRTGMPSRGGIRYPVWTQYPEQAADTGRNGWHGTAIAYPETPANPGTGLDNPQYFHRAADDVPPGTGLGNTKKCISGPCVDWREVRQSIAYLCIESDILRDRTFPEGIARFSDDVLIHHQHYLNEIYLAYIAAHSDPIPAFSVQQGDGQIGSTSLTVVDRLALLITWMRGRYKMAENATLEIVFPEWFREYLKRDIEKKQNRPFGAVSNAEVAALFGSYASRVQWVRDWQELGDGTAVSGRIMPPGGWPSAVNILAYPAGSWVLSEGNILTFGVQYDYSLLAENRYSASFTEDAWMLVNRCNRTFTLQLTELCANGAVGPAIDACAAVAPAMMTTQSAATVSSEDSGSSEDTKTTGTSAGGTGARGGKKA
jgi:hypothetical protein